MSVKEFIKNHYKTPLTPEVLKEFKSLKCKHSKTFYDISDSKETCYNCNFKAYSIKKSK